MNKEIEKAFEWLERRHTTIKELAAHNKKEFKSDYMQGIADGERMACELLGEEIEKIRQMLDGFMVEDVILDGMKEGAEIA